MLGPKIPQNKGVGFKACSHCRISQPAADYTVLKGWFYHDNLSPVCNTCISKYLSESDFAWDLVDELCRYFNIPFIPEEFVRLHKINGDKVFQIYAKTLQEDTYSSLGWKDYYEEYRALADAELIENEIPLVRERLFERLEGEWGKGYDEHDLLYLDNLYRGMLSTQNVNGALQTDQARKLCKISLEIEKRIQAGQDFDKLMGSYDRLVKTAEFTPQNSKNENDIDSVGELFAWLERRGWINKYYDNVTRDAADEVIQNIQTFNQRLYINEPGIGDEVNNRIEALKHIEDDKQGKSYDLGLNLDLEAYEQEGYDELIKEELRLDEDIGDSLTNRI